MDGDSKSTDSLFRSCLPNTGMSKCFVALALMVLAESLFDVLYFDSRTCSVVDTLCNTALGICHLAQAVKGDTGDTVALLKGVGDKGAIEDVKHVVEMMRIKLQFVLIICISWASSRRGVLHTDFLTPPVLKESMLALENLADVKAVAQGGYPQAERCRLSVGHPDAFTADPDVVAAMSISGNFGFQPCSHGDFLGSVLGTGITRDKLGDIILQGEKGAHILLVPELVDFLTSSLDKVGNVSVTCKRMPLIALEYEPPRLQFDYVL
ncbi:hypothetical protein RJ639_033352 [Escallonia herrerae]|uniref:Ribosome-associated protein quality control protein P2 RNA-binding domain-containing protein n=1 Tax=Escallonia herrerae TaxID=1293975 RepID=A0AA88WX50_9ASTE|nr:hypothetical protein RJ639_033352 [Escallonia herrerae]